MAKPVTKKSKKRPIQPLPSHAKHKLATLLGIAGILLLAGLVAIYIVYPAVHNQQRLDRITAIFNSVDPSSDSCLISGQNVFGDKRLYPNDKSRSFSSAKEYVCNGTVSSTVATIKSLVAKTDFRFYQEPYPGSNDWEYIYKSPKKEYLRISVSSKRRDDAFFNDEHAYGHITAATFAIDPNAAPSNVTIKVNLDDNNE